MARSQFSWMRLLAASPVKCFVFLFFFFRDGGCYDYEMMRSFSSSVFQCIYFGLALFALSVSADIVDGNDLTSCGVSSAFGSF